MNDDRFVIIGGQRCGTSYLYQLLDEHPAIAMAKPAFPEPKFFLDDKLYARGKGFYEKVYYQESMPVKIYGEKSASYYEYDICARRIKESYPEIKIIIVLRDPMDRAISNYFYSTRNGFEKRSLVEVFVEKVPPPPVLQNISTDPFNYLGRGEYLKFLEMYEKHFSRDQMIILFYEELTGNMNVISGVYKSLGVATGFVPGSLLSKINSQSISYDSVDERVVKSIRDHFVPYNEKLEIYLNRTLDCWKIPA